MKLAICRYCNQPMLRTFTYCPRCGMACRTPGGSLWILAAVAFFVTSMVIAYFALA